jgi:uncharacterized protein HemX
MGEGSNGMDASYGKAKAGAHGALGIVALVAILAIGGVLWVGTQGFASITKEHAEARTAIKEFASASDRMACVLSLTPEERLALRRYDKEDFWSKCPWVRP